MFQDLDDAIHVEDLKGKGQIEARLQLNTKDFRVQD